MESNPVNGVTELLAQARIAECPLETFHPAPGDEADGGMPTGWECSVSFQGTEFTGGGPNKKVAKKAAYSKLLTHIRGITANMLQPALADLARAAASDIGPDFMYRCIRIHLSIAAKIAKHLCMGVIVLIQQKPNNLEKKSVSVDGTCLNYETDGVNIYALSSTSQELKFKKMSYIYLMQPMTVDGGDRITLSLGDTKANTGTTGVQGAEIAGSANNPGVSTIPQLPNPVPTAMTPAMNPPAPPVVAALEPLVPHECLNPAGPPNMLSVGAIGFDIKDLVYSQFIDSDAEISFAQDKPSGEILFQVPYDPLGMYMNPYIKSYVGTHERYAGPILVRITLIGNSTYSGLVGVAWAPRPYEGTKAKLSDLMRFSYVADNVSLPYNKIHILHDARKSDFYREVNAEADHKDVPHLVGYVHVQAQSPLTEKLNIRIRIATKLSAGAIDGCEPFQVALPRIAMSTPDIGVAGLSGIAFDYVSSVVGLPVVPMLCRPLYDDQKFYAVIDGTLYKPQFGLTVGDQFFDTPWYDKHKIPLYYHITRKANCTPKNISDKERPINIYSYDTGKWPRPDDLNGRVIFVKQTEPLKFDGGNREHWIEEAFPFMLATAQESGGQPPMEPTPPKLSLIICDFTYNDFWSGSHAREDSSGVFFTQGIETGYIGSGLYQAGMKVAQKITYLLPKDFTANFKREAAGLDIWATNTKTKCPYKRDVVTGKAVTTPITDLVLEKYVTDHGPVYVLKGNTTEQVVYKDEYEYPNKDGSVSYYHIRYVSNVMSPLSVDSNASIHVAFDNIATITSAEVFNQYGYPTPEYMPTEWRNFALTSEVPFVVTEGINTYQTYHDRSILPIVRMMAANLKRSDVIQFELSDIDTTQPIAFPRYLPDRKCMVVNAPDCDQFMSSARAATRMYVSGASVVSRSSTFPQTYRSGFVSNVSSILMRRRRRVLDNEEGEKARANAGIAAIIGGSAISGLGQGLSRYGDYAMQKRLMEMMMGHQMDMMNGKYGFMKELNMQDWAQQFNLSALNHQNNLDAMKYRQELAGYMTGGAQRGMNRASNLTGVSTRAGSDAETQTQQPLTSVRIGDPIGESSTDDSDHPYYKPQDSKGRIRLIASQGTQTDSKLLPKSNINFGDASTQTGGDNQIRGSTPSEPQPGTSGMLHSKKPIWERHRPSGALKAKPYFAGGYEGRTIGAVYLPKYT